MISEIDGLIQTAHELRTSMRGISGGLDRCRNKCVTGDIWYREVWTDIFLMRANNILALERSVQEVASFLEEYVSETSRNRPLLSLQQKVALTEFMEMAQQPLFSQVKAEKRYFSEFFAIEALPNC